MSPVNHDIIPLLFGSSAASSDSILPAFADVATASESTLPETFSEYSAIASPNGTILAAKSSKLFSPINHPSTPPLFGRFAASSDSILPAFADVATASGSTLPDTASEYAAIASPNGTISSANLAMEDPPVNQEAKPFRTSAAVRARIMPASAPTPSTMEMSIFDAPAINP